MKNKQIVDRILFLETGVLIGGASVETPYTHIRIGLGIIAFLMLIFSVWFAMKVNTKLPNPKAIEK